MIDFLAGTFKALGYATLLGGAGAVLSRSTLLRSGPTPAAWIVLVRTAGVGAVACVCGSAVLLWIRLGAGTDAATLDAIFGSSVGAALALQLVGALCLTMATVRTAQLLGAMLILVSFGAAGHAATRGMLTSATVIAHVAAVAWWLGGLLILLIASRRLPADRFADLVSRFSSQATWIVVLLVSAALITAVVLLEFRFDLQDGYLRGLLAKVAMTSALLGLAGLNRLVFAPGLVEEEQRHRSMLQWSIVAELVLFACVMVVTAWLTTWTSPHVTGFKEPQSPTGPIAVLDAWAPPMPGGVGSGAGYMIIVNNQSTEDRLVAASSPWAEHVGLYRSMQTGAVVRMREAEWVAIPPQGRLVLAAGAYHLMFRGLHAPFVAGDVVPVVLTFARAGRIELLLSVRPFEGVAAHHH